MLNTIGHTPESHLPIKLIGIETKKKKINYAENKTRYDQSLEFLPKETKETLAPIQLKALIAKDVPSNKSYCLYPKATDEMT